MMSQASRQQVESSVEGRGLRSGNWVSRDRPLMCGAPARRPLRFDRLVARTTAPAASGGSLTNLPANLGQLAGLG